MPQTGTGASPDGSPLDYEVDITRPSPQPNGDISYGPITFFRNKNPNGLLPELYPEPDGGSASLRLAVKRDAYLDAPGCDALKNDRCELRDSKLPLGTAVCYSFEMRADPAFPVVDAGCVCAQIKAPYYDANGGSPLFALRIDRGRYFATIEHLYEIKDAQLANGSELSPHVRPYAGPDATSVRAFDHHVFGNTARDFKELQVRAVLATDSGPFLPHLEDQFRCCTDLVSVTQGVPLPDDIYSWRRFTVRVAPTKIKDADGILQLLVDDPQSGEDVLVAEATGEFGHVGYPEQQGNDGPPPDEAHQYFKIGPYRDKIRLWGCQPAAIHVRNIRRGDWAEGATLRAALVA